MEKTARPLFRLGSPASTWLATARIEFVGWNFTSRVLPTDCWFQLAPESVVRQIPVLVAASRMRGSFGSIARRFTKKKFALAVAGRRAQVRPPSAVLKMPAPRTASKLKKPSPVPA